MRSNNLSDLASADVFQRLLKERIIFLGSAIDETVANQVCAQLLLLAAEDAEQGHQPLRELARADRSPTAWPSTTPCST